MHTEGLWVLVVGEGVRQLVRTGVGGEGVGAWTFYSSGDAQRQIVYSFGIGLRPNY